MRGEAAMFLTRPSKAEARKQESRRMTATFKNQPVDYAVVSTQQAGCGRVAK